MEQVDALVVGAGAGGGVVAKDLLEKRLVKYAIRMPANDKMEREIAGS
jgi:hypothetical protein